MKPQDFNDSTLIPRYSYVRSPVNARAFLIMERVDVQAEPVPVGDYTVLDRDEDIALAEKKVMTLMALMNGRAHKALDLGDQTKSRLYYKVLMDSDEEGQARVMFYTQKNEGVSKENALFRIGGEHVHGHA